MLNQSEHQNAIEALAFLTVQKRTYAIYGTGQVAMELLTIIRSGKYIFPVAFIKDSPEISILEGIKVISPEQIDETSIKEVILGTNSFQEEMRKTLESNGHSDLVPIDLSSSRGDIAAALQSKQSRSETAKVRQALKHFCIGNGPDVGFGGDPITDTAICIDLPNRYAAYQNAPQHLQGDAQSLPWFKDKSMDYVYSSHVLEDFENTRTVLDEWIRVLRVGGSLVLFLPDEQAYRNHCKSQNKPPNVHHVHLDFSLDLVKSILLKRGDMEIIHEKSPSHIYSFELIARRIR
ncbi:MAG: hypothetical protein A2283_02055 [Lentisphaerae bacterium RIFOXYA12_FULL_48_11]|nr:MAG: hypothetical protein A2283_02055 [Lentisphaerae bacterium RIFOXYA12_FULL_48_11]